MDSIPSCVSGLRSGFSICKCVGKVMWFEYATQYTRISPIYIVSLEGKSDMRLTMQRG